MQSQWLKLCSEEAERALDGTPSMAEVVGRASWRLGDVVLEGVGGRIRPAMSADLE